MITWRSPLPADRGGGLRVEEDEQAGDPVDGVEGVIV
jgi:hypothetical protein